jgi:hypothetical protein
MDARIVSAWLAVISFFGFYIKSSVRRRTVSLDDIGPAVQISFSTANLLPQVYLMIFGLIPQLHSPFPKELYGYEYYISIAAGIAFVVSVQGIITGWRKGLERKKTKIL